MEHSNLTILLATASVSAEVFAWIYAHLGEISGILLLLSLPPYLISTWRCDGVRPTFAGDLIWVLLGGSAFWAFVRIDGFTSTAWVPLVCVTNPLIVGLVSLYRRNFKPLDRTDWVCLTIGATAAAALALTERDHNRDLAILAIAMVGDTAATVAVIRNIMEDPLHEHAGSWTIATAASYLDLFTVDWSADKWREAIYPAYIALTITAIVAPLWIDRARRRFRRNDKTQPLGRTG